jgi:glutamate racemase
MKIGVFDSGIGGKAVAERLQELIPSAEIMFVNDHEHVPYGTRPNSEILTLTTAAIQPLLEGKCDVIVIACNTATTIAITHLRETYPHMKFVGIEPMVKPAASLTKSRRIAVLATPATLKSERYRELKAEWAPEMTVYEPDCASWAELIETGKTDDIPLESLIHDLLLEEVDVIVLACTHYHWLKPRIENIVDNRAVILEPSDAISRRVIDLLQSPRES